MTYKWCPAHIAVKSSTLHPIDLVRYVFLLVLPSAHLDYIIKLIHTKQPAGTKLVLKCSSLIFLNILNMGAH